jgi:hypothetical protein
MNYPIQKCIQDGKSVDEILGIYYNKLHLSSSVPKMEKKQEIEKKQEPEKKTPSEYGSFFVLFSVLRNLLSKLLAKVESMAQKYDTPKYEIFVNRGYSNDPASGLLDILYSSDKRKLAIESGIESARMFLDNLKR